ncbi:hypothetical protein GGI03_000957 [Coemansia sp. RSA 2337]|nr:hypothetical protein H4S04_007008 [Coemansia sp. S16]KAJ2065282.1 hypothetical protein GGI08_002245 [Coemansia sp. S2]KAJ2105175.1 hypothetical protein IW146_008343 [Coemansia sp. RSA 922]KAJ2468505.1 hypothetical protein GGI03_000957 [Coemansia sp. RSA 2337]
MISTTVSLEQRVSKAFELLEDAGKKEHVGGKVTRLDHALQVAQLAKNEDADDETILAALLYDIGHLIRLQEKSSLSSYSYDPLDRLVASARNTHAIDHGRIGAKSMSAVDYGRIGGEYLRQLGFPKKTCELIESDVMARRYILTVDPQRLITPAVVSVVHEMYRASPLSPTEMREFEKDPLFKQKVQMRRWNYFIKVSEDDPAPLDTYREMAIRVMSV